MKNLAFSLGFLVVSFTTVSAQTDTDTDAPFLRFSDAYLLPGGQFYSPIHVDRQNFQALAPQSQLLQEDMAGYEQSALNMSGGLAQLNLLVGFQVRGRSNTQLRLGINMDHVNLLSSHYSREDRWATDTLVSTQTGNEHYVDSVNHHTYNMSYRQERVGLHVSYIWRTDTDNRWGLYGGVGGSFSYAYNTSTSVRYDQNRYTSMDDEAGSYYNQYSGRGNGTSEEFHNQNSIGGSLFVPMGVDWRIGKGDDLWSHLHLFWEGRPGIGFVNVPELETYTRSYFHMGFGLRYSVN